jgi:hypothetical protein
MRHNQLWTFEKWNAFVDALAVINFPHVPRNNTILDTSYTLIAIRQGPLD